MNRNRDSGRFHQAGRAAAAYLFCGALLVLAAVVPAGAAGQETWSATYPLSPTGALVLENVRGQIEIEGWDRAEVAVFVRKSTAGDRLSLGSVDVLADAKPGRLVLRTFHRRRTAEPVRVDYRLLVPRQVRLEHLSTVEGDIRLRRVEGPVEARTLNGNILGDELAGPAQLEAGHGNIAVSFRQLPEAAESVRLETLNGNITLVLPAQADAQLSLSTVAGRIDSPYSLRTNADAEDFAVVARAGRGGARFQLSTVRGDIQVREKRVWH